MTISVNVNNIAPDPYTTFIDYGQQIGKGHHWTRERGPITAKAYELKPGHPWAKHGDVIAVEMLPAGTIFRANGERFIIHRDVWENINQQNADTWEDDGQGHPINARGCSTCAD